MAIIANYNLDGLKLKKVYIDLVSLSGSISTGWSGTFGVWSTQAAFSSGDTKPFTTISTYVPSSLNTPQFDLQQAILQTNGLSAIQEV